MITWASPWPLSKELVSKLVRIVLRQPIVGIKLFRIEEVFVAVFNWSEIDMDYPALWDDNVGAREEVILGTLPLVGGDQALVPGWCKE